MATIEKDKKLLVIVESPAKVKTLTKIFKNLGYKHITVMASVGHIRQIKDNKQSCYNTGIYPDKQFKIDWEIIPDKYKVIEALKQQINKVDLVLLAMDGDREGESISKHLKEVLDLKDEKYYRIKFHSITEADIKKALEAPEKLNMSLCHAALSRQCTDKLIGYSLSSFAKKHIGARSVGRCQSVGLLLTVERENEINNFIPEKYYNLYLTFVKDNKDYKAKYIGYGDENYEKIKTLSEIKTIKYHCENNNYIIEDISEKKRTESPKLPFCTATFQQEAATKLGLKVKDAMSIAQKLYEDSKITYMRTDDTSFSQEFLDQIETYVKKTFGKSSFRGLSNKKDSKNISQNGHECLRVCDITLTPEQFAQIESNNLKVKIYTLIWQRTIAAVLSSAVYLETIITINNNNHKFVLSDKALLDPGFKIVYQNSTFEPIQNAKIFEIGEILKNTQLIEVEKETTPPARFTEASLVKELQDRDIGRPSTYATIVETILSPTRGYASLEDKQIVPTDKGIQLAEYCKRAFPNIINLKYTREMELYLDDIAAGKLDWLTYMDNFYKNLSQTIENNQETGIVNELPKKLCPVCNNTLVVRRSRFGKLFYACTGFPKCRYTESI